MARVKEDLSGMAAVEQEPKLQGKSITMTLAPLPANKRKRRFLSTHDLPPLEDDDEDEDEDEDGAEGEAEGEKVHDHEEK
jgi:translation initiation factor IF-3